VRYCTLCGEEIDSDAPHYYTKCRACYRGAKQRERRPISQPSWRGKGSRAERFKNIAIERRHRIEELETQVGGGVAGLTPDRITELLLLVHPDRHRNSPESNSVTRWLLEVRARQRNAR
jgi:hypothetical protein